MNTTQPAILSDGEYKVFKKFIWNNRGVCNNCFSRIEDVVSIHKDYYWKHRTRIFETFPDEITFTSRDGEKGFDEERADEYGEITTDYQRTTCSECGSVGGLSSPEDFSKRELLDRLDSIIDRLEEQGFEPDEEVMREVVHESKSRDSLQGYDKEILAAAVKMGTEL